MDYPGFDRMRTDDPAAAAQTPNECGNDTSRVEQNRERSFDGKRDRIILLNHSSGHEAAFVFRDDDLIRAGTSDGVGVPLLPCPGYDLGLGIERPRRHGDVEIIRVVVDDNANAP